MSAEDGIVFRKGWLIVCPGCGAEIAEAVEDIFPGILDPKKFKVLIPDHQLMGPTKCPKCGDSYSQMYGQRGYMHSNHGWQPPMECLKE